MISIKSNLLGGWGVAATSSAPAPPPDAPSLFIIPPIIIPTAII